MNPRPPLSRASRAFTLIELLTTISIIVILAALLLQTAGFMQEKAANSRAQAEIASLENALEAYKLDFGTYPEGDGSATSTKELVDALLNDQVDATPDPRKPYFEIPIKMMSNYRPTSASDYDSVRKASHLVDPFGNPYFYKFPGESTRSGEQFFDLWSRGKSNANDEARWIKNW